MNKTLRFTIFICTSTICSSCGIGIHIEVFTDKSALIRGASYEFHADSARMAKSPIITDFKSDSHGFCSYKIADIDSLGNYMGDIVNTGYFNFKYYPDSLVIYSSNKPPLKKDWDTWYCCGYTMKVDSDKKIKQILRRDRRTRFNRKAQEVEVFVKLKQSKRRTKSTNLAIMFEK